MPASAARLAAIDDLGLSSLKRQLVMGQDRQHLHLILTTRPEGHQPRLRDHVSGRGPALEVRRSRIAWVMPRLS